MVLPCSATANDQAATWHHRECVFDCNLWDSSCAVFSIQRWRECADRFLAFAYAKDGIRVNAVATGGTEAPPRKIPRNAKPLSEQEEQWMQDVVDQTKDRSHMKRYGTIQEQVNAILFLASDESSYMTGTVVPVGGGDQG